MQFCHRFLRGIYRDTYRVTGKISCYVWYRVKVYHPSPNTNIVSNKIDITQANFVLYIAKYKLSYSSNLKDALTGHKG